MYLLVDPSSSSLLDRQLPGEHRSFKGRSEDPLRVTIGPLLPEDVGLGGQPAYPWKRLACGQDIDDADEDVTQIGRRLRAIALITFFFRRCDAV